MWEVCPIDANMQKHLKWHLPPGMYHLGIRPQTMKDHTCGVPTWSDLGRSDWMCPAASPQDCSMGRSGCPDAVCPLLLLGGLPECSYSCSSGQRTDPWAFHQEKTSKKAVPCWNVPSLVRSDHTVALDHWIDVSVRIGPTRVTQGHPGVSPNRPSGCGPNDTA